MSYNEIMRRVGSILLLLLSWLCLMTRGVYAEEKTFNNDYKVEYFVTDNGSSLLTRVKFAITVTNLTTEQYVDKIALAFPKSYVVNNLKATDDHGSVVAAIQSDDLKTRIELKFTNPAIGRNTVNHFNLEFTQDNLFRVNGNTWEAVIPTIEDKTRTSYTLIVHLPPHTSRKISIAKPKPDSIEGTDLIWDNPKVRTIYAVFGTDQYYDLNLQYHLQNPKSVEAYTEVAFPPDTQYQKSYVTDIKPAPSQVYVDDDGNYIGRYTLKPREKINVIYQGTVALFTQPRAELKPLAAAQFEKNKNKLLTTNHYWNIASVDPYKDLKTPQDIYSYITRSFTYDFHRLGTDNRRLGADLALKNPTRAVCVEFTDAFVGMAREQGIFAREIEGYGVSQDPQLRPLSAVSDVLHAWPEYYDSPSGLWRPVDPTWENTSGIDYFSSFDLNHIALAIHGTRDDSPLPAGMYKLENSKDVHVTTESVLPQEHLGLALGNFHLPAELTDQDTYRTKITVINNSNVFLYDVPVSVKTKNLAASVTEHRISVLAPYQRYEIPLELRTGAGMRQKGTLSISVLGNELYNGSLTAIPFYFKLALRIAFVVLGISIIWLVGKLLLKLRA